MTTNSLEELSRVGLAHYATDVLRRTILQYGIWFKDVLLYTPKGNSLSGIWQEMPAV